MKSVFRSAAAAAIAALPLFPLISSAHAAERDRQFFEQAKGNWTGPGEIIAGKYKGTKFNCSFEGITEKKAVGITMDGGCRVGVFLQKMTASIEHKAGRYSGKFMDGADGKGLDIISGSVVDDRKVVLAINRKQLRGIMQARLADDNTMNVTVSVRVEKQLVPVIGMSLKRVDGTAVGSID
ncbi:MAG: hypothetical protein KF914_04455 [Rhizobiaceae bacterium]|nr:hypothetical protein [Rhizobiaceae bacterium]